MQRSAVTALVLLSLCAVSLADPCGMVPPVYVGDDVPIARIGVQKTYVFHKDGIETFVIRPGFRGKVEEFGMLIPMPAVPALRKVSDNVFPHVAAAVDPPEVVVYANVFPLAQAANAGAAPTARGGLGGGGLQLMKNEVRVVKEEAVGMYEVAVLEAGSSKALEKWMDDHGYRYPNGMDVACNDYVDLGWCFVAVKTKVGAKSNVDPKPGQRTTNPNLPAGSTFDGHVQAMGFRFASDELVVPMRLSTFNEGDLRNVVYVLSDDPLKIKSVPAEYVVRQVPGSELINNVTEPLPLRIVGGTVKDLQPWQKKNLPKQRDPAPHNGAAKQLFADDLLAVAEKRLVHPHEETEKMLLRIGERLQLRGPAIDQLNEKALDEERSANVAKGLELLEGMTLTVIDGNFPRAILASQNLRFDEYTMPSRRNTRELYDAPSFGPRARQPEGALFRGKVSAIDPVVEEDQPAFALSADESSEHARMEPVTKYAAVPWYGAGLALFGTALAIVRRRRSGENTAA